MATYTYQVGDKDNGIIDFNLSITAPAIIERGTNFQISGRVSSCPMNATRIDIGMILWDTHGTRYSIFTDWRIKKTIKKGGSATFTSSFTIPNESSTLDTINDSNYFFGLFFSVYKDDHNWTCGSMRIPDIMFRNWALDLNFISGNPFIRCDSTGDINPEDHNKLTSVKINNFKATISSHIANSVSLLTIRKLDIIKAENGTLVTSKTIPYDNLLNLFSADGWNESIPSFFNGITFDTNTVYYIDVTIGIQYEQVTQRFTIGTPTAIVSFSLKQRGGFAVGMYHTSTDDNPKFEVAESHTSIFNGPVEFKKSVSGLNISGRVMGFTAVRVENSTSSTQAVEVPIPIISGANSYICTGVLGWSSGGRPIANTAPEVVGNTLTATLAANSIVTFNVIGIS